MTDYSLFTLDHLFNLLTVMGVGGLGITLFALALVGLVEVMAKAGLTK